MKLGKKVVWVTLVAAPALAGCVGILGDFTSGPIDDTDASSPEAGKSDGSIDGGHDSAADHDATVTADGGDAGDSGHFVDSGDAGIVDAAQDTAPLCVANAAGCDGEQPVVCNDAGTANTKNGAACSGATPSCVAGKCIACTTSADCGGTTPKCDGATNTCVQCLPGDTQTIACGNCGTGTETDTCTSETWSKGACSGTGCGGASAVTVACNTYGTFTCDSTCTLGTKCSCPLVPVCAPTATKCSSAGAMQTCDACGQWAAAVACSNGLGQCENGQCDKPALCTRIVPAHVTDTSPFAIAVTVSYGMVGGGGGGGSATNGTQQGSGGGGGGSSVILVGGSIANAGLAIANGGVGGRTITAPTAGVNGTQASGSFSLLPGASMEIIVGGGGGGGGTNNAGDKFGYGGGGGGSGYYGGAGGGNQFAGQAQAGTTTGGVGSGTGSGGFEVGGLGFNNSGNSGGAGGNGPSGGAGAQNGSLVGGGGGGGGFGGGGGIGGGSTYTCGAVGGAGNGGTNGGNATCGPATGANSCGTASSIAVAVSTCGAGNGGASQTLDGFGGNGGIVILSYTSPNGNCSL